MRPFATSWYLYQLGRVIGWLLVLFAGYGFFPQVTYPFDVPMSARTAISLPLLLYGGALILACESGLVWLQIERNTADLLGEMRRLRRSVERFTRRDRSA